MLINKTDIMDTKKRFIKWWKREETDRPLLSIPVMNWSAVNQDNYKYSSYNDKWTNIGRLIDRDIDLAANTRFCGESYPGMTAYLGPGSLGAFIGSELTFEPDTIWYEPIFSDITKVEINFMPSNEWWKWTLDFYEKAKEITKGQLLLEMPDLIENLDTIATLIGAQQLLYDLYDYPETIHIIQKKLLPIWFEVHKALYDIIKTEDGGMCFGCFSIWAPGTMAKLQCDFSAMISPDMFGEFVLPYLKQQCDALDYSLYHLDGPGELPHLDLILSIDSLDAIQWVPSPGFDPADASFDYIYRRILDAGKAIHLSTDIRNAERFIKKHGKKGVFIRAIAESEKQAYDLIDASIKW